MKYIIPKGGKMLFVGKKVLKLKEGEYDTTDKEEIKSLEGAKGVKKKTPASKAE